MTKKEFDNLYLGKAVHCKTEELANEFLELAKEFGYCRGDNHYDIFKEETCFRIHDGFVDFSELDFYKTLNFEIIEFKSMKTSNDDLSKIIPIQPPFFHKVLDFLNIELNEEIKLETNPKKCENLIYKFDDYFNLVWRHPTVKDWQKSHDFTLSDLITGRVKIVKIKNSLVTPEELEVF